MLLGSIHRRYIHLGYIHLGYIHLGYIHLGYIHLGYIHLGYIHLGYIHLGCGRGRIHVLEFGVACGGSTLNSAVVRSGIVEHEDGEMKRFAG